MCLHSFVHADGHNARVSIALFAFDLCISQIDLPYVVPLIYCILVKHHGLLIRITNSTTRVPFITQSIIDCSHLRVLLIMLVKRMRLSILRCILPCFTYFLKEREAALISLLIINDLAFDVDKRYQNGQNEDQAHFYYDPKFYINFK